MCSSDLVCVDVEHLAVVSRCHRGHNGHIAVSRLKKEGIISGGMIPKIDCCVDAVRRGVGRAHIIDGRTPHSILVELFTDEGIGTMFY